MRGLSGQRTALRGSGPADWVDNHSHSSTTARRHPGRQMWCLSGQRTAPRGSGLADRRVTNHNRHSTTA
ncbi:hypothetical protein CesoFtcFv8_013239 [Champsocephalus esox]|uniref:Uncharacterized protein n=1 Tax=Champsocephalus esox TaxID=159716 RepID=A0AAN8BWT5_9TELE|nr:hypothetical protein CesoFtcFv8_013239 [Champsocephalus esox]